jgi:hypothetical protein
MRKLALALTVGTFALAITALPVGAQTLQLGAGKLQMQLQNATPVPTLAACRGPGRFCRAGWVRRCWRGPYGHPHCHCVPC